ncbi:MAG: hypothetical protein IKI04_00210, partial [Bacilli bacterium]|nr:hypothetical protein [Bacilli bacterium]
MAKQTEQTHDKYKAFQNKGDYGDYIIYKENETTIVREPEVVTADTPVHVYFTGQIGDVDAPYCYGTTTSATISEVYAEDPDYDGVLVVVYGGGGGGDAYSRAEATDNVIKQIEEEHGVKFNRLSGTGSSSGDAYAAKFIAYEAMNGRTDLTLGLTGEGTFGRGNIPGAVSTKVGTGPTVYDPNGAFFTDEEAEAMKAANTKINVFERGDRSSDDIWAPENFTTVTQMNSQGLNPTIFHCNSADHNHMSVDPLKEGLFNLYDYDEGATHHFMDNYSPVKFNSTTGSYNPVTYDDYMASASYNPKAFSYLDYISGDDYEITPYEVESAYKELKDIGNVGISYLDNPELQSNLHDPTIVSDLQVVSDHMTAIRNSIKSSSATGSFQGLSFGGSGAGGMLGCIMGYIQAYYNAVGALLSSLTAETDSITSFAQAYADMDADYTNKAGDIMAMDLDGNMKKLDLSTISKPAETPSSGSVNYNETGNAYRPSGAGTTSGGTAGAVTDKVEDNKGYTRPDLSIKEKEDGTIETEAAYDDDSRRVTTYDETGSKVDTEITDSSVSPAASATAGAATGAAASVASNATGSATGTSAGVSSSTSATPETETSDKQYTRPNVTVNEKEDGT